MHPSSSGLLVIWAYLPHTTLPDCVTSPNSLTFTSTIVPVVFIVVIMIVYEDVVMLLWQ